MLKAAYQDLVDLILEVAALEDVLVRPLHLGWVKAKNP
jgi:hypothetical protein